MPTVDNANYLWIQIFSSALNEHGPRRVRDGQLGRGRTSLRAGDPSKLIEDRHVDVMVAIGSNFFYTVTLPVTLWFLDKGKRDRPRRPGAVHRRPATFIRQIDRAHRDFLPEQIEFLANIVRLYRGEEPEFVCGSEAMLKEEFPDLTYADVAGLVRESQDDRRNRGSGWSLNPGRYVGVAAPAKEDFDFVGAAGGAERGASSG